HKFATQGVVLQSVLGTRTAQGSIASLADRMRQRVRHVRGRGLVPTS
ncbi:MAG: GNAT family N-acetyltransferase, partial [Mesorhizobium sp.]